jgi:hypothetical protein
MEAVTSVPGDSISQVPQVRNSDRPDYSTLKLKIPATLWSQKTTRKTPEGNLYINSRIAACIRILDIREQCVSSELSQDIE